MKHNLVLKLKVPSPVWALLAAICIWVTAKYWPVFRFEFANQWLVAVLVFLAGSIIDVIAMIQFRRARTTVNPLSPEKSTELVTTGIFSISRNPMYLGMALNLVGITIWFGDVSGLVFVALFVVVINQLQIKPEEEILTGLYGDKYTDWMQRVRRWI